MTEEEFSNIMAKQFSLGYEKGKEDGKQERLMSSMTANEIRELLGLSNPVPPSCPTCKHQYQSIYSEPCSSCMGASNWGACGEEI